MGSHAGRRKVSASPTSTSVHASPNPSGPSPLPIPRIRLSARSATPIPPPPAVPTKRRVGRPRKNEVVQRAVPPPLTPANRPKRVIPPKVSRTPRSAASNNHARRSGGDGSGSGSGSASGSDSSDLTPQEDDMEVDTDERDEMDVTPRKRSVLGRPKSSEKGKERERGVLSGAAVRSSRRSLGSPTTSTFGGVDASVLGSLGGGVSPGASKVTVSGPAGRERRRAIKLEEAGRRRARDAKFDVEDLGYGGPTPTQNSPYLTAYADADDGVSSFGDDESDTFLSPDTFHALGGFGLDLESQMEDDETRGLPEAFAGQDIEDLAYGAASGSGAGHALGLVQENQLEREAIANWWHDEDEEMFIATLSGSEADQQSQSSVHESDPQSDYQNSTSDSEAEDEVDEFGFPIPSALALPDDEADAAPLVLMENWDGQFVLVQPRQERSRSSRRRGSRGSRTNNGSVAGSTIAPSEQQDGEMNLVIDPEAVAAEFGSSSSDEWSGMSDEDDGDTTDSMDEDDMPQLDSPAMQELIEQQIGLPEGVPSGEDGIPLENGLGDGPPAIIVTDTTIPETPALSSTATTTPNIPNGIPSGVPQTPVNQPVMGTFLPTSTDPAQHAVIDGSKTTTKSPFTHRRKSRKARADSMSSAGLSSARSMMSALPERKRKSRSQSNLLDPFAPPMTPFTTVGPTKSISKKARYTSIPGHPKFIAAQRQMAFDRDFDDAGSTPSEDDEEEVTEEVGELELEDMLEMSAIHEAHNAALNYEHARRHAHSRVSDEHIRHLIRFDRIPVSAYIRRNLGASRGAGGAGMAAMKHERANLVSPPIDQHRNRPLVPMLGPMSSPIRPAVSGLGNEVAGGPTAEETLVGEAAGKMVISPLLAPIDEMRGRSRAVPVSQLQL